MTDDFEILFSKIIEEVRSCGEIILSADRSVTMIDDKAGHANFVTSYDKKVQAELEKRLLSIIPEAAFAGEEGDDFYVPSEGIVFIVDPIDGTTNFIYDYKVSCISVGILKDDEQLAGIVFNPYLDEMFSAIKGEGAFLNGKKISVFTGDVNRGLSLFGTSPYNSEWADKSFEMARKMLDFSADVRRSGSAAIDLCNVAAGRATMYFEYILSPWDFAAGSLILEEAGGIITTTDGGKLDFRKKGSCVARCPKANECVNSIFGI